MGRSGFEGAGALTWVQGMAGPWGVGAMRARLVAGPDGGCAGWQEDADSGSRAQGHPIGSERRRVAEGSVRAGFREVGLPGSHQNFGRAGGGENRGKDHR